VSCLPLLFCVSSFLYCIILISALVYCTIMMCCECRYVYVLYVCSYMSQVIILNGRTNDTE